MHLASSRFTPLGLLLAIALVAGACGSDSDSATTVDLDDTRPTTAAVPVPEDQPTAVPATEVDTMPTLEPEDMAEATEPAEEDHAGEPDASDPEDVAASSLVDLTDQILSASETNCAAYTGEFTSMITDVSTESEFEGMLMITSDGSSCTFTTNQIPNHDVGEGSRFATDIGEVDATLTVPVDPQLAAAPTALGMGASVIMLNGVKWEAYPAACFGVGNEPDGREAIGCGPDQLGNPWRYNIGSPLNNFGFDIWMAHVQPNGLYHYHSTPISLYEINCEGTAVSPVVGFAADGFPVHGPCFLDEQGAIRAAQSSYQIRVGVREDVDGYTTPYVTGNVKAEEYDGQFIGDHEYVAGSGDLDECNGMTVDGEYGYYITGTYPYVLPCYSGTPSANFR